MTEDNNINIQSKQWK